MIKVTRTQNRPSTSVVYYIPIYEKTLYTTLTFLNTKKLSIEHIESEDNLTKTSVWLWKDQESFDEYSSNPLVIANKKVEEIYHDTVGITFTEKIENI